MPLAFAPDESHPMVDTLLRTRVPRWEKLNRAIDERDDMLDFALKLFDYDRDRALTSYFHVALEQFALVRTVAQAGGGQIRNMLDFASGYGRLTRLLVHDQLAEEITVSDILEGAMEFQAEQFGVRTLLSTSDPARFSAPGKYDLIFVASLFTHLPAATFTGWLRRLVEFLEPGGLLVFSVHDEAIAPQKVDGIHFAANSESRVLDTADYGSTWVTEAYVRSQLSAIDGRMSYIRMPRVLGHWQDVYIASRAPLRPTASRKLAKGFVDNSRMTADGIHVSGWATGVGEKVARIEVRVEDDIAAATDHFGPRPDVAAAHGASALESGWACFIPRSAVRSLRFQVVTISAITAAGDETILFLDVPEALNASSRERVRALENQIGVQAGEIAAMKRSLFWRARDRSFALARLLGRGRGR